LLSKRLPDGREQRGRHALAGCRVGCRRWHCVLPFPV
jgi:hypothetical protein